MRSFVALGLGDALRDAIAGLQDRLPVGRPVPPENLHLTLAFLGDQSTQALETLHEELSEITAAAFQLRLQGLHVMGGSHPKVLYLQAQADERLSVLHKAVRSAARRAGLQLERRRFMPHVTLARFGGGLGDSGQVRLGQFILGQGTGPDLSGEVSGFGLYESVLTPERAYHHILADYPLSGLAIDPR